MAARPFGLPENPFKITPDPRFLYRHSGFERILGDVRDVVLNGRGIAVVGGRPGMGKTMLLTTLAAELRRDSTARAVVLMNCSPETTADALLGRVAADHAATDRTEDGRTGSRPPPVLLLDEAQNLTVEDLRGLLEAADPDGGAPRLRVVLAGGPELAPLLRAAESTARRRQVGIYGRLRPLTAAEVEAFVAERLKVVGRQPTEVFSESALAAIARYASGVPRLINSLCATALFLAESEAHRRVSADLVRQAAQSLDLLPPNLAVLDGTAPSPTERTGLPAPIAARDPADRPTPQRGHDRPGMVLLAVTAGSLALFAVGQSLTRNGGGDLDASAADRPVAAASATSDSPAPARVAAMPSWHPRRDGGGRGAVERRIASLLGLAKDQVSALKLTTPRGDNALDTYREILALRPGHEAATAGIHELGAAYADLSRRAAEEGRWANAWLYYERGIALAPRHPALIELAPDLRVEPAAGAAGGTARRVEEAESSAADGIPSVTQPWRARGRLR